MSPCLNKKVFHMRVKAQKKIRKCMKALMPENTKNITSYGFRSILDCLSYSSSLFFSRSMNWAIDEDTNSRVKIMRNCESFPVIVP